VRSSKLVGMIPAILGLSLVGCDPPKAPSERAARSEHSTKGGSHEASAGFSSPVPPIEPSPIPQLPSTPKGDPEKKEEAKPAEKKAEEPAGKEEGKSAEKKAEEPAKKEEAPK
jgi:hypothetical protein